MVARIAGGLTSFLTNRYWTWGANRQITLTQQGRRFVLLYILCYASSVALFQLLTEAFMPIPLLSKLATDISCFATNFMVMNFYVYHALTGLDPFLIGTDR